MLYNPTWKQNNLEPSSWDEITMVSMNGGSTPRFGGTMLEVVQKTNKTNG